MHISFLTRGPIRRVDDFTRQLSAQYLQHKSNLSPGTKDKTIKNYLLRTRVCPIQLWDVSFPHTSRDVMLTTLFKDGKGDGEGKAINPALNKYAFIARKMMGLKSIPKEWDSRKSLPCLPEHTEIIALGMKEDIFNEDGVEMI